MPFAGSDKADCDRLLRLMTWNPCGVEYSAFRVSLLN